MRIGFDVSPLTPARTGVGNYCYYLLKHLLDLPGGHEMLGFATGRRGLDLGSLEGRLPVRHWRAPTRAIYALWNWAGRPRVDAALGGVDVYHATNYYLPPVRSAKTVVTVHDLAFLVRPELCSPRITRPFARGIGRFCRRAGAIMAYSEATRRDLVERLGVTAAKVTVAPMAVDEAFAPMSREAAETVLRERFGVAPPFLLYVSTLEPRKNVPGLLEAFARVKDRIPHNLVLVGSVGWNADPIFETIARLGLQDRIIRPGFVRHLELPAFYCAASAFVFPTYYEGFGLPLLEALTCGCPVVTSDNSSVPEVTGGAALYSGADDHTAIADNILRVLEDGALRADLAARGKAHAAQYAWRDCAATTLNVYQTLADP